MQAVAGDGSAYPGIHKASSGGASSQHDGLGPHEKQYQNQLSWAKLVMIATSLDGLLPKGGLPRFPYESCMNLITFLYESYEGCINPLRGHDSAPRDGPGFTICLYESYKSFICFFCVFQKLIIIVL